MRLKLSAHFLSRQDMTTLHYQKGIFSREQHIEICKAIKRPIPKGIIVNERLSTKCFDSNPESIHEPYWFRTALTLT